MTKGCVVPDCQRAPAKKAPCCGQKLCDAHRASSAAHSCPRQAELRAITSDPKRRKEWLAENSGEEGITPALVEALNALPDIELAWQSRKRGGVRANDAARAVADVTAIARGGLHVEVELKGSHKKDCPCTSCTAQRDRGERIRGAGGVYIDDVRTVQDGVDGVRLGLARARTKRGDAA